MSQRGVATVPSDGLPAGVRRIPLRPHVDYRGSFTELFREEWGTGVSPVQWNFVRSEAGVLRGAHVHIRHRDYLVLVEGRASIFLHDLRRGSATEAHSAVVELAGDQCEGLVIPTGVVHAFLFHEPSIHIYSVSEYWDVADELGCHWSDPGLGLPEFPVPPTVSPRDAGLPPLSELLAQVEGVQPFSAVATPGVPAAPDP